MGLGGGGLAFLCTPPKTNSSASEKLPKANRKGSYSNDHFSGANW